LKRFVMYFYKNRVRCYPNIIEVQIWLPLPLPLAW
jgi:hypothetical protein